MKSNFLYGWKALSKALSKPKKAEITIKMGPSERQNSRVLWKSENEKIAENCRSLFQSHPVFYMYFSPILILRSAFFGIEMAIERAFQPYKNLTSWLNWNGVKYVTSYIFFCARKYFADKISYALSFTYLRGFIFLMGKTNGKHITLYMVEKLFERAI